MRRFLIIDAEGDALRDRATVTIQEFQSNPEESGNPGDRPSPPRTENLEEAISMLADRQQWNLLKAAVTRSLIVVPLDEAYTVNVRQRSLVEISSTGSMP